MMTDLLVCHSFQRLRMGFYDGRPCEPEMAIRQASQALSITFCDNSV